MMKLAEFKLIDRTQGALTWKIVERIQKTVEEFPDNQMKYFSSMVAKNQGQSVVIDMNVPNREITVNLQKSKIFTI